MVFFISNYSYISQKLEIMTPKEKAQELFIMYVNDGMVQIKPIINRVIRKQMAKQCAIIAVNNMIEAVDGMVSEEHGYSADAYYLEVKQEIEAL